MNRRSLLALFGLAPFNAGLPVASSARPAALIDVGELAAPLALAPPQVLKVQVDEGRIHSLICDAFERHGITLAPDFAGFIDGDGI